MMKKILKRLLPYFTRRETYEYITVLIISLVLLLGIGSLSANDDFLDRTDKDATSQNADKSDGAEPEEDDTFSGKVILGNERLFTEYNHLIDGKRVGIITNQTGVNGLGESTYRALAYYPEAELTAIYVPEHGLEGLVGAGELVSGYIHKELGVPVFSLYGDSRRPTAEMLAYVDVLLFDIQDIGSRTYTYVSTLRYVMEEAKKYHIPVVVLDRPNPLGDKVDGFVMEDAWESFVGVDNMPIMHGMTAGELGLFFNREIGAKLKIVPMTNYYRDMVFPETELPWVQTSPNIPSIEAAFCYMASGMGEGTSLGQADYFTWMGSWRFSEAQFNTFLERLRKAPLEGCRFEPEMKGSTYGVNIVITDYHAFNPLKISIYSLCYARALTGFPVPTGNRTLFEKLWGTERMGWFLTSFASPEAVIASYQDELNQFKKERESYLIYKARPTEKLVRTDVSD